MQRRQQPNSSWLPELNVHLVYASADFWNVCHSLEFFAKCLVTQYAFASTVVLRCTLFKNLLLSIQSGLLKGTKNLVGVQAVKCSNHGKNWLEQQLLF